MKYLIALLFSINAYAITDHNLLIEHQVRLCDDDEKILENFGEDSSIKSKLQEIYYAETKDFFFQKNKWSLRFREKENEVEVTIKLRSESFINNPPNFKNIECEFDLHGKSKEYACKLNAIISKALFQKIVSGKKEWTDALSLDQETWLKSINRPYGPVFIWGKLTNKRYQINDFKMGKITLDLVHPEADANISYHELSIRYYESNALEMSKYFNNFLAKTNIHLCPNQIDWETDKYQVLIIQN